MNEYEISYDKKSNGIIIFNNNSKIIIYFDNIQTIKKIIDYMNKCREGWINIEFDSFIILDKKNIKLQVGTGHGIMVYINLPINEYRHKLIFELNQIKDQFIS